MVLEGFVPYNREDADKYAKFRWWAGLTFGDILDKASDVYPDKEALADGTSCLTYSQLRTMADRLAVSLMELGIEPQERVLLQIPNWNEFAVCFFAIQKIGAIDVLAIPRHGQTEIKHLLGMTGATTWIVAEQHRSIAFLPIAKDVRAAVPHLKRVILVRSQHHKGFLNLEEMIGKAPLDGHKLNKLAERRPDPMDVAHMGPTGGTTGLPKVAPRTHNDYLCKVEYAARAWELNQDDVNLLVIPIGHDAGFGIQFLSTVFTSGKTIMVDSTLPEEILAAIQNEKATCSVMVPGLVSRILDCPGLRSYDTTSLAKLYISGQAIPHALAQRVHQKLGCKIVNAYGGTEGMITMTRLDHDQATVHTTVGRPCCPYDTYQVVDEDGRILPPDTVGELCVKGPCIFSGYYRAPEENRKAFTRDGFFRTGDQARIARSGNVTITGRLKDIIKRGGENISPIEIEGLVGTHPDVEAVAVVGMPDPYLGERICAYVQPRPGTKPSFESITSFLKSKGASVLQLPERIEYVETMPTVNVKIDKKALREDIKKKLDAESRI